MSEKQKVYCSKCGKAVFLDPKLQRNHKINTYYMYAIILSVIAFIAYIYIEMIAVPIMTF